MVVLLVHVDPSYCIGKITKHNTTFRSYPSRTISLDKLESSESNRPPCECQPCQLIKYPRRWPSMKLSMKDRLACKEWYIRRKARQIMSIPGDSGLAIKTALLSGLRTDEIEYAYNQQVCAQDS